MILGNYAQLAIEGSVILSDTLARKIVLSFTYRQVSGGSSWAAEKAALGSQFLTDVWSNHWFALLSSDFVGQHCWVTLPWLVGDVALDTGTPANGSAGGNRLPIDKCCLLFLRTGLRGKSYQGRKYVPCQIEANVSGDEFVSFIPGLYKFFASSMLNQLTTSTGSVWQPVVWSRKLTGNPLLNPGVGADLVSIDIPLTVCNWRHRRQRENPGVISGGCPGVVIPYSLYLYTDSVGCPSIDGISHLKLTWNGSFWGSLPYAGGGLSSPFTFAMGYTGPLWNLGISDSFGFPQWNCTQFGAVVCKPFVAHFKATGRSTTSCFGKTNTVTVQST